MTPAPDDLIDYDDGIKYWSKIEPTVNGVLGGYGEQTSVPRADIVGSHTFMRKLKHRFSSEPGKEKLGIDMGAGIGRVTRDFLVDVCDKVDLLEPVTPFVVEMKKQLEPLRKEGKIGEIYEVGMQDWDPKDDGAYYLIWCQWCCGHLTDEQFIEFLGKCRDALQEDGMLVLKENNAVGSANEDIFDPVDSSKTRSDANFRSLFKKGGFKLIATCLQNGVPRELYPIRMYALKPKRDVK